MFKLIKGQVRYVIPSHLGIKDNCSGKTTDIKIRTNEQILIAFYEKILGKLTEIYV